MIKFREYGLRPDFCEAADPESKGVVEALVGYAKSDLVVPAEDFAGDPAVANAAAQAWCGEVNAAVHSEIAAIPEERLALEREVLHTLPSLRPTMRLGVARKVDKLSTVRIGSARYSVPHTLRGQHVDVSTADDRIRLWRQGSLVAEHRLVRTLARLRATLTAHPEDSGKEKSGKAVPNQLTMSSHTNRRNPASAQPSSARP